MVTSKSVLHWLCSTLIGSALLVASSIGVAAQTVEVRQWQGAVAVTHQPEQMVASTLAEWRSLWSRVGLPAPDVFEAGRTSAIFFFQDAPATEIYTLSLHAAPD